MKESNLLPLIKNNFIEKYNIEIIFIQVLNSKDFNMYVDKFEHNIIKSKKNKFFILDGHEIGIFLNKKYYKKLKHKYDNVLYPNHREFEFKINANNDNIHPEYQLKLLEQFIKAQSQSDKSIEESNEIDGSNIGLKINFQNMEDFSGGMVFKVPPSKTFIQKHMKKYHNKFSLKKVINDLFEDLYYSIMMVILEEVNMMTDTESMEFPIESMNNPFEMIMQMAMGGNMPEPDNDNSILFITFSPEVIIDFLTHRENNKIALLNCSITYNYFIEYINKASV